MSNQKVSPERHAGKRRDDAEVDFEHEVLAIDRRDAVLCVRAKSYRGAPFVDVRLFTRGQNGQLFPTSKGVAVRVREIDAVASALREAARVLDERSSR